MRKRIVAVVLLALAALTVTAPAAEARGPLRRAVRRFLAPRQRVVVVQPRVVVVPRRRAVPRRVLVVPQRAVVVPRGLGY